MQPEPPGPLLHSPSAARQKVSEAGISRRSPASFDAMRMSMSALQRASGAKHVPDRGARHRCISVSSCQFGLIYNKNVLSMRRFSFYWIRNAYHCTVRMTIVMSAAHCDWDLTVRTHMLRYAQEPSCQLRLVLLDCTHRSCIYFYNKNSNLS